MKRILEETHLSSKSVDIIEGFKCISPHAWRIADCGRTKFGFIEFGRREANHMSLLGDVAFNFSSPLYPVFSHPSLFSSTVPPVQ